MTTVQGGFTSIGRLACVFLAGISAVAATAATDGTWASATAGGSVQPDGFTARYEYVP